jgi:hypothetical protein
LVYCASSTRLDDVAVAILSLTLIAGVGKMLREQLVSSLAKLKNAIENSRIYEALRLDGEKAATIVVASYNTFLNLMTPLTAEDKLIMSALSIEILLSADWWAGLLTPVKEDKGHRERVVMMRHLEFATDRLPRIMTLLDFERREPAGTLLKLVLPEQKDETSTPLRITDAIDSIRLLYSALCNLHNEPSNTLAIVRCDSGSDKSFDFTGLPQIIEQVKNTVFEIVDRVIYYRERKYSERVKCVAESLPVIAQIADMVETKKLPPEQAELLKRDLIAGASKFLQSGAQIPELREGVRYDPNSLLETAPTLLLEAPKETQQTNVQDRETPPKEQSDTLSPDEIQHLKDLIARSERNESNL